MLSDLPNWLKDSVFYQIFPDRFAYSNSIDKPSNLEVWDSPPTVHGYKGGDLIGIWEKLDYLQDLGVTTIYLNPIFQALSNHRYNTHDYFQIDPILGGNDAFRKLLNELHRRKMKLILDGVFGHTGRGFLQFSDILENGPSSPWKDWYNIYDWPIHAYSGDKPSNYSCWHGNRNLPKLNTDNQRVKEYIFSVIEYWLKLGVDGWRLDTPESIQTDGFWEELRYRAKKVNKEAYLVGEVWRDIDPWLKGDRFDGVTNYLFTEAIVAFVAGDRVDSSLIQKPYPRRDYFPYPAIDASQFGEKIQRLLKSYRPGFMFSQLNLLDSHDTPRILTLVQEDIQSVKLAVLLQMSFPGIPCIYYGDEIGLRGGPDPDCRRGFPWNSPETWEKNLLDYYKRLLSLRNQHRSLRYGDYMQLYASGLIYSFARQDDSEASIIVINADNISHTISLPVRKLFRNGQRLTGLLTRNQFTVYQESVAINIDARSGEILALA